MKNINIFSTSMFPYLEGEEIKGTTLTLTIRDMRTEEMKSHKGIKEQKEVLYFSETSKGFVLNKTNAKCIAQMYGSMTAEWERKQITLTTEKVKAFGEIHDAIRVIPGAMTIKQTMNLPNLLEMLNRISRIKDFYQSPDEILDCRPSSSPLPDEDDLEGWRVMFLDARDYANREVSLAEIGAEETEETEETEAVEIFVEEDQDITPDESGPDLPDTDGIANV